MQDGYLDNHSFEHSILDSKLESFAERIEKLEQKIFKTSKKEYTNRAQQILLLQHLGILDRIKDLGLNNTDTAKLLAALLNSSEDNIRKDLSKINSASSELITEINYKFLASLFAELKLESHEANAEKTLTQIRNKRDKKNNK